MCLCAIPAVPASEGVAQLYQQIFIDYRGLCRMKKRLSVSDPTQALLLAHLDFICRAGANLVTTLNCPFCQKNKIKLFTIPADGKIKRASTCCGEKDCMGGLVESLDKDSDGILYPIGFSALIHLDTRYKIIEFIRLLRCAAGFPEDLSSVPLHRYLVKNYQSLTEAAVTATNDDESLVDEPADEPLILPNLGSGIEQYYAVRIAG